MKYFRLSRGYKISLFAAVFMWTLIISASMFWTVLLLKHSSSDHAHRDATNALEKDLQFRQWFTNFGGVYVPVSESTQPNPYLAHIPERDMTTPSGRSLTLMNACYMTRKVTEMETVYLEHVTSLNPLNPANAPKPWETEPLQQIIREGLPESSSIQEIDGKQFYTLMRPMIVGEFCLKCHAGKVGDVRGAISVAVPMDHINVIEERDTSSAASVHGLVWIFGMAGMIFGIFRLARSETERNASSQALVEQSRILDAFFKHSLNCLAILDKDFNFIRVNEAYARECARHHSEFPGHNYFDFNPSDAKTIFKEVAVSKKPFQAFARPFTFPDRPGWGETYWDCNLVPILSEKGEVDFLVFALNNVTERKKAEDRIVEKERYYRSLLYNMHEDILVIDKNLLILDTNRDFLTTFGRSRQEIVGRTCYEALYNESQPCKCNGTDCAITRVLKTGISDTFIHTRSLPEGSTTSLYKLISPLKDSNGQVSHVICAVRDNTQEIKLEGQLRQAQKMEAVGTLAGGIAHDFNNILAIVVGNLELIKMSITENEEIAELLKNAIQACYRGRNLVRQILTFSRKSEQEKAPLLLAPIIDESVKLLKSVLPPSIEIRKEIAKLDGGCMVMGESTEIQQIVMNLCTNAKHAMGEKGGVLEIKVAQVDFSDQDLNRPKHIAPGSYVKMSISDNGCGMDAALLDRIFDPFFTTKEVGQGTGLGLSVVHGIVRNCGGAISVYSEPNRGTAFNVFLPCAGKNVFKIEEEELAPLNGTESILLVEDEQDLSRTLKEMLGCLGYKITVAENGRKALDLFSAGPGTFDLIITDQTMPVMTGTELAGEVMKIRPDIPIILCTGFSETLIPERIKESGIREFAMKPLMINELSILIRRLLDENGKIQ